MLYKGLWLRLWITTLQRTKHTKFWLDLKDTLWQSLVEPITPCIQSEEWWGFESAFVEIDFINLYIKKKNYQVG
jgi:hypothetical protein